MYYQCAIKSLFDNSLLNSVVYSSPASHTAAVSDCNPPGVITFQAQDVTKRG